LLLLLLLTCLIIVIATLEGTRRREVKLAAWTRKV